MFIFGQTTRLLPDYSYPPAEHAALRIIGHVNIYRLYRPTVKRDGIGADCADCADS